MRRILLFLFLSLTGYLCQQGKAQDQVPTNEAKPKDRLLVLKNGTVFTGEKSDSPTIRTIYICNDTIVAVTSSKAPVPKRFSDAQIYDLKGKFVLPGLVDAHVHLITEQGGLLEDIQEKQTKLLQKELMAGVTTVRDMGGDGLLLGTFARSANAGRIASPDIFYSAYFAGPEYYNKFSLRPIESREYIPEENLPWNQTICDNSNVVEAITRAKASGATGIKLYNDLSSDMLKKLSTEAKRQGLCVWAHATVNPPLPSDAIGAGVEVLSHAYLMPYEQMKGKNKAFDFDYESALALDQNFKGINALFDSMKKNNVILDATIYLMLLSGEDTPDWRNSVFIVKAAHARGVKICIGTDWMYDEEKDVCNITEELRLFVEKCGFTPLEAIVAATQISAEAIGLKDRGVLASGKRADILILNKDPFSDIRNIKEVDKVIKRGIVY